MSGFASPGSTYDALPYASRSLPQTHPDGLAIAAKLHGLSPAAITDCRVLELGCADGTNLLPMAAALPQSRFVGIDLSPRQIASGQEIAQALGLENLELRAADLLTLDDSLGEFDYIICHGVYSWVPPVVQDRILQIAVRHLAPQGVAYISYNTYPGFHKRQPFREMMQFHTARISDPLEAAEQGRALLEFVLSNINDESGTYAHLVRDELEKLRGLPLSYLFHEHLEEFNLPCYFHEFISRAQAHDLQFLTEAEGKPGMAFLPEAAQQALAQISDIVRREQYIDFLRNSSLRSTLLCHRQHALLRDHSPAQVRDFYVVSSAQPEERDSDPQVATAVKFRTRLGAATVDHPAFKALLYTLYERRPLPHTIDQLVAIIAQRSGVELGAEDVCEMVLYAYRMGLVMLRTHAPPIAEALSEKPRTSELVRLQARLGRGVSNPWHEAIAMDSIERPLLARLDGETDVATLVRELVALMQDPQQHAQLAGLPDPAQAQQWMPSLVREILEHCLHLGLISQ